MSLPQEFVKYDEVQKYFVFKNWLDGYLNDHQLTQRNYHIAIDMFERIWKQFQSDRFAKWNKEQNTVNLDEMQFSIAQLNFDSDDFRINIQELQKKVSDLEGKLNKPSP